MTFGFYSSMPGAPWGGSEELWWRTARRLQDRGHRVAVNYAWWPTMAEPLREILEHRGTVFQRNHPGATRGWRGLRRQLMRALNLATSVASKDVAWLDRENPDAVVFTLGYHTDRIMLAAECHRRHIPYALNVQAASSSHFIPGSRLDEYRSAYRNAARVYFVSKENRDKLETNLAMRCENSEIVENPFGVEHEADPAWPSSDEPLRLACVGRLHFASKGQDLILDVMQRERWRARPLEITFFGKDDGNLTQLTELIRSRGLETQLRFGGFASDMERLWSEFHGLLLPSRYEGAALVVVEAMMCQRIVITTDTGRNTELIDEGETGFIAPAATADSLDRAMEEAWTVRGRWREMGRLAGKRIRERYSKHPVDDFANALCELFGADQ